MVPPADRDLSGRVRAVLSRDRAWSVYALGDLGPEYFSRCSWFLTADDPGALILLYRGPAPPVLFSIGAPLSVARLLNEVREERAFYLHVKPEIVEVLAKAHRISGLKHMWRMTLDPANYRPVPCRQARRLGTPDLEALQQLYADGKPAGESPDFFFPEMLDRGVFFGMEAGGELASVAGTHLAVPAEGVAAVGNIYTRRECRGRGLASQATSAVVEELRRLGISTIGLNVSQDNEQAIRVYEKLGFVKYCAFCEGLAERR